MKTFTALILNIVYPGAGYLYLKDDFRKTIAKFLVFVWTLFIATVLYMLIEALISGNFYRFNLVGDGSVENPGAQMPFLAVAMWGFMVYDTFKLARNQKSRALRLKLQLKHEHANHQINATKKPINSLNEQFLRQYLLLHLVL